MYSYVWTLCCAWENTTNAQTVSARVPLPSESIPYTLSPVCGLGGGNAVSMVFANLVEPSTSSLLGLHLGEVVVVGDQVCHD